jgi:YesN/AraC family two-component response regulator
MEYFYRLKIEEAKRLIRNGTNNFTQIADKLGYSTIHYFSRQFKKIVGMSPSEYSKSILHLTKEDRYKQF